ncbi:hypothetical protein GCM10009737_10810 [Nocardioides lentus]|uniref:FlgD/Vpr Ig-like domain-containing protein n=1 Tax=Nocardioides lentus TaxID=338077 RepID=A0ABP5ADR5_9ACTN
MRSVARPVIRTAVVLLLGIVTALGLSVTAATSASAAGADDPAREGGQVWGFIDTPRTVEAGWDGALVAAWRNASEDTRSYRVTLDGAGLAGGATYAWSRTLTLEPGGSFREELVVPALTAAGRYTARLTFAGVDVVTPAVVTVGPAADTAGVRVLDLRRSAAGIHLESARRTVAATFGVSRDARVSASVTDARGRSVLVRSLGQRAAGSTHRWAWDGRGATGRTVVEGTYTLRITAVADGQRSSAAVRVRVTR